MHDRSLLTQFIAINRRVYLVTFTSLLITVLDAVLGCCFIFLYVLSSIFFGFLFPSFWKCGAAGSIMLRANLISHRAETLTRPSWIYCLWREVIGSSAAVQVRLRFLLLGEVHSARSASPALIPSSSAPVSAHRDRRVFESLYISLSSVYLSAARCAWLARFSRWSWTIVKSKFQSSQFKSCFLFSPHACESQILFHEFDCRNYVSYSLCGAVTVSQQGCEPTLRMSHLPGHWDHAVMWEWPFITNWQGASPHVCLNSSSSRSSSPPSFSCPILISGLNKRPKLPASREALR